MANQMNWSEAATTTYEKNNRHNAGNIQPGAMDSLVFGRLMVSDFGWLTMGIGLSIAGVCWGKENYVRKTTFRKRAKAEGRSDEPHRRRPSFVHRAG